MNQVRTKPKIILIPGMHRSGTSLTAQLVATWGAWMGDDLMKPDQYNKEGYWEYMPLVYFHNQIFDDTNNTWFSPVDLPDTSVLLGKYGKAARELVNEMDLAGKIWCWKDPRMFALLDFWCEILHDREIIYIIPIRNPISIAVSILKRDYIPYWVSINLWEESISKIFGFIKPSYKLILADYDNLVAEPGVQIAKFFKQLNEASGENKPSKTLDKMKDILKPELDNMAPGFNIDLSPQHDELYEACRSGKIPEGFFNDKHYEWLRKNSLRFYKDIFFSGYRHLFAQLFYSDERKQFSEAKSVIINVEWRTGVLSFKLPEFINSTLLRFDPLNHYCHGKILSIHFLRNNTPIDLSFRLYSDDYSEQTHEYFSQTKDPQVFIEITSKEDLSYDEVIIELKYLEKGADIIPYFLENQRKKTEEI